MENFKLALGSLRANKMRAVLTMLGIIIGVASVIGIVSVGSSMSSSITEQMQSMGIQNIYINVQQASSGRTSAQDSMTRMMGGESRNMADSDLISLEELDEMMDEYEGKIDAYAVTQQLGSGQAKSDKLYANVSIIGVSPGYETVNDVELTVGRFVNQTDMDKKRSVCIVSDRLAETIYGGENPVGQKLRVYLQNSIRSYTIIGVYPYDASSAFGSTTSEEEVQTDLYIPVTTAKKQAGSANKNYSSITVYCNEDADVAAVTEELTAYWEKKYARSNTWTASVSNLASQIESVTETMNTVYAAIAAIAAISLLVGGIGVMNIMLVSVTERTHEIGIRKALGAENGQIQKQFIIEAGTITLIGGIIGVALGILIGYAGSSLMGSSLSVSPAVIAISVAFSTAIGLFFGAYPASKAAKLDPIDALRHE